MRLTRSGIRTVPIPSRLATGGGGGGVVQNGDLPIISMHFRIYFTYLHIFFNLIQTEINFVSNAPIFPITISNKFTNKFRFFRL